MATVADLHKSITNMSYEEAFHLIRDIRSLRRELYPPNTKKTIKSKSKKSTKKIKPLNIEKHISEMSNESKQILIENLIKRRKK